MGAAAGSLPARRQRQLNLRSERGIGMGYGVNYGIGAYGSPIGQVTGVQSNAASAPTTMGPQFVDGGGPVAAAPTAADSGAGTPAGTPAGGAV